MICVAVWLGMVASGAAQDYGLDELHAVGPFLNGNLPDAAVRPGGGGGAEPPALLSQTGAFSDTQNLIPSAAMIPYAPVAPFWSDGAEKKRWLVIPNDGIADSDDEQISFSPDANWEFPIGTVLVKHFDMPVDARDPQLTTRIETRFLVRGSDGDFFGFAYRWRDDQSDAELVHSSDTFPISQVNAAGDESQLQWTIPSRSECLQCHTFTSGGVLGVRTHQLNATFHYPLTDRSDNQLRVLAHLGFLSPAPDEDDLAILPKAVNPHDESQPLADRARSYIDTNCASCHRPRGVYANFDARFTTPLDDMELINGHLVIGHGIDGEGVVRPGDPDRSIFLHRLTSLGPDKMPPIGKARIDERGIRLIREWIESVNPDDWDGTVYDASAVWRRRTFEPDSDPSITAWDADPDGDAMANVLEFALGTHGHRRDGNPVRVERSANEVLLKLTQPLPRQVTVNVEISADAMLWETAQDVDIEQTWATIRIPTDSNPQALWFRLRALLDAEE